MYYYAKDRQSIRVQLKGFSLKGYTNNTSNDKRVHINKHYKYIIKCLNNEHLDHQDLTSEILFFRRSPCLMIFILQRNISNSASTLWCGDFHDWMAFSMVSFLYPTIFYRFSTRITPIESKSSFKNFQLGFLLFPFLFSFSFFFFII